jgi:hypothetical protein
MREFFSRFLVFACCLLVPVASAAELTPMDRAVTVRRSCFAGCGSLETACRG